MNHYQFSRSIRRLCFLVLHHEPAMRAQICGTNSNSPKLKIPQTSTTSKRKFRGTRKVATKEIRKPIRTLLFGIEFTKWNTNSPQG